MYIRLYKFLDKFKCVYKKQFGFRNFRPSTDVILQFLIQFSHMEFKFGGKIRTKQ